MQKKISWGVLSEFRKELMGCSIIGIILFHWYENCMDHGIATGMIMKLFSLGNRFVDVFLILSGIGLFYSFSRKNDVKEFYKRRFGKILPVYCIIAFPYWIVEDIIILGKGWKQFLCDFTFMSLFTQGNRRFWFIAAIVLFYLIFPPVYYILYKGEKKLRNATFILVIYFLLGIVIGKLLPSVYNNIEIAFWRWLSFFAGIYLAPKVKNDDRISNWSLLSIFVIMICSFIFYGRISSVVLKSCVFRVGGTFFGIIAALVIATVLKCIKEKKCGKLILSLFGSLGEITLEVYMLHVAFRSIFGYPAGILEYGCLILCSVILAVGIRKTLDFIREK